MEAFFMKENDKVLISKLLLKATFVLLVISVFLKLCGLNVFGADTSNAVLISISNFIDKYNLKNPLDWLLLFLQFYLIYRIVCKNKRTKYYIIYAIIAVIIISFGQLLIYGISTNISTFWQNILYFALSAIITIGFPIIIDRNESTYLKGRIKILEIFKKSMIFTLII